MIRGGFGKDFLLPIIIHPLRGPQGRGVAPIGLTLCVFISGTFMQANQDTVTALGILGEFFWNILWVFSGYFWLFQGVFMGIFWDICSVILGYFFGFWGIVFLRVFSGYFLGLVWGIICFFLGTRRKSPHRAWSTLARLFHIYQH